MGMFSYRGISNPIQRRHNVIHILVNPIQHQLYYRAFLLPMLWKPAISIRVVYLQHTSAVGWWRTIG